MQKGKDEKQEYKQPTTAPLKYVSLRQRVAMTTQGCKCKSLGVLDVSRTVKILLASRPTMSFDVARTAKILRDLEKNPCRPRRIF